MTKLEIGVTIKNNLGSIIILSVFSVGIICLFMFVLFPFGSALDEQRKESEETTNKLIDDLSRENAAIAGFYDSDRLSQNCWAKEPSPLTPTYDSNGKINGYWQIGIQTYGDCSNVKFPSNWYKELKHN